jgi:MFS family permease
MLRRSTNAGNTIIVNGKKSRMGAVLFHCMPKVFRLYLKRGVPVMTMVTCWVYDVALFLIFSVNILFHDDDILVNTEISLLISCLLFGILFEIMGRKRIFTMRLCVTSICSLCIPFFKKIDYWMINIIPTQTLAFVMCSVSLTVPFIPDFVKYRYRGLAYSYTGLLFAIALCAIQLVSDLDVQNE